MYAKEVLMNLDCWDSIRNRVIPASSVRTAQQYVETAQCELGIVYYAGATQSDKVNIITIFDETLHSPIRLSAACAADNTAGNDLLDFLNQSIAMNIFSEAGFISCKDETLSPVQTASFEPAFEVNIWQTLLISLKVAAVCTLAVAAPGILLGYILARKSFRGRSVVNAFVHLPMVIPPVVAGYLGLVLLGKNSFLGHWLYDAFGISIAFSWIGAVVVSAVMGLPLLIRSVKTAVEMIDQRYSLAARTLGASSLRAFFTVTIPLAGPGILAGLILAFARCLGEFGATAMFAGNIPGKTQTLSLAIFNFTQIPGAESTVMQMVGISILLSFGAMLGSEFLNQRMKHLAGVT
jgi:molybdate transport system permease protein